MALPLATAAAPADAAPPADPMAPAAPMADEGADDPWQPFVTVMKNSESGEFRLVSGDEPEGGMAEGPVFKDGPGLLKGLMDKIEGGGGAEESFAAGFKGEPDPAAKPAPMPMK